MLDKSVNCTKPPCIKTYGNGCKACYDKNVEKYTDGKCDNKGEIMCESERQVRCTEEYEPVCGIFYKTNCENDKCIGEYENGCSACSDKKVEGYVKGKCDEENTLSSSVIAVKLISIISIMVLFM